MKILRILLLFNLLWIAPIVGCKSPEQTAYVTASTFVSSVDVAMKTWADYVVSGQASKEQQDSVRNAYGKYQAFVAVAKDAAVAAKSSPDGYTSYQVAINIVYQSAADVIRLVQEFTKQK